MKRRCEKTDEWPRRRIRMRIRKTLKRTSRRKLQTSLNVALTSKIAALDVRIEDIASEERYAEKVNKLKCIKGIKTHTALSFVCEIGDFNRFK